MLRRELLVKLAGAALLASCSTHANEVTAPGVALSFDDAGRTVANVMINGRGPYAFVIDTAAQRPALGQSLIDELGLTPAADHGMLTGATGSHASTLYNLDQLALGAQARQGVVATSLVHHNESSARGIFGADAFADQLVTFDYARRRLIVEPAGARVANAAPIELRFGTFAIAQGRIGATDINVVIDTGSQRTLGNTALMRALGFSDDDPRLRQMAPHAGVAGTEMVGQAGSAPDFRVAGRDVGGIDIVFGRLPVFAALGLDDGPAMILGEDVLHRFSAFTIDYHNRRLAIR